LPSLDLVAWQLLFLYRKKLVKSIVGLLNQKNITIPVLLYIVIMGTAYLLFPPNPDKITISMDLIMTFRIAGAFTIGIFWGLMGIILGYSGIYSNHMKPAR